MISALVDLLASYYQAGNLEQTATIARSMLNAMPDDLVALQFLALALFQLGRIEEARRVFRRVAARFGRQPAIAAATTCESAAAICYREATRPDSGLAEGWQHIARLLARLGFERPAAAARAAALSAQGVAAVRRRRLLAGTG